MAKMRHAIIPGQGNEFSFCGLAFDAFDSGDHDSDDLFEYARPGLSVTCPDCCEHIKNLREAMKGLRLNG